MGLTKLVLPLVPVCVNRFTMDEVELRRMIGDPIPWWSILSGSCRSEQTGQYRFGNEDVGARGRCT